MVLEKGCFRGYHRPNKAWYAEAIGFPKEITFGIYHGDGGCVGEMQMVWYDLSASIQRTNLVPRLEAFHDSWKVLNSFGDLFMVLEQFDHKGNELTEDRFCELLNSCGFQDRTAYIREK